MKEKPRPPNRPFARTSLRRSRQEGAAPDKKEKQIPRRCAPRMTAKTKEREKPPFEAPFETQGKQGEPIDSSRASPFDPLRVSLCKQGKQGPATSFVVACAFAPVAGALGYKKDRPFAIERRACGPRDDSENKRARKAPGPRNSRGRPGLQKDQPSTLTAGLGVRLRFYHRSAAV
jgi:hypothetical protein